MSNDKILSLILAYNGKPCDDSVAREPSQRLAYQMHTEFESANYLIVSRGHQQYIVSCLAPSFCRHILEALRCPELDEDDVHCKAFRVIEIKTGKRPEQQLVLLSADGVMIRLYPKISIDI